MNTEERTRQTEQELLMYAQRLREAKRQAEQLKAGVRQAWNAPETAYILEAVEKAAAELTREIESMETLAAHISEKAAQQRVQAELLQTDLLLADDGLF